MDYNSDLMNDTSAAPAPAATPPAADPRAAAINPHPVNSGIDYSSDLLSDAGTPPSEHAGNTGPAPDWSQVPGLAKENFIPSGTQFLGNMAHAVMHPIESAENIGSVGLGYMEKAGKHLGLPSGQGYEKYADAVNQMVMDRYGSMDNFKKTLATDPVGAAADLSAVLTGGEGLAGRLPGVAGDIAKVAGKVGRTVDPMNLVTKPVGAALGAGKTVTKEILGHTTGAGPEAISAAASAGFKGGDAAEALRENMRGNVPIEKPVADAMDAVHNIVENKNADYKQGMAQAGLNQPISRDSFNRIRTAVYNASDIGRFKGWQYNEGAAKANNDLRGIFGEFLNKPYLHTVEGLDALKQAVGDYKQEHVAPGSKAGIVADGYYNAIKDGIIKQAPKYAEVMENYGEAKDLLSQIQKSFSLPADQRKLNIDTALRKLQSVMRNNANTNWGYRKSLLESLKERGAPNIEYALAGQSLSAKAPRGLAKISSSIGAEVAAGLIGLFSGNPGLAGAALKSAAVTATTSSPRLVGEAAYYSGRAAKPVSKVLNRPVARVLNQTGRIDQLPAMQQARGGAIGRAKRMSKHHG